MGDIDFSKVYSFSKLDLFEKCKQQYYFYYLDPEISPRRKEFIKPRDYKIKGSAVHDAITLFYHLPIGKRNFANLKQCLLQAWYSEDDVHKQPPLGELGGFNSIQHERKTYQDSLILLRNFFELKDIAPSLFLLPTKNIKYSFDDYKNMIKPINDEFQISGKFDRIDELEDGKLRIVDFKTGKNKNGNEQLEFYKLLAEMNFDAKVDKASFYYLADKNIKDYDFTSLDTNEIKKKIEDKINTIKHTTDWPAEPNFLCNNHCDFKEICPHFN